MKEDCRIAVVSMASITGRIDLNVDKIINITKRTVKNGAKLVVFPEMALQGYSNSDMDVLALTLIDPVIKQLARIASELQVTLLVGFAERSEDNQKPYISQLVAFPDGKVSTYRKVHLGRLEKQWFTAGTEFPVFSSQGIKFAVGICWDWHFPEMAAIYSLKGAEVLFAPHASLKISGNRNKMWKQYMGTRAYDNSVYLAACNMSGVDSRGREFSSGAMVWGPKGEILAESLNQNETVLYSDLSAFKLNELRTVERKSMKDSFFLAYRRKEMYTELLELEVGSSQEAQ